MEDYKFLFKVVLVGNAGVGKTCLVRRFTQGLFPPGQGATIGVDFMIKTVEVDGEKVKVSRILRIVPLSLTIEFLYLALLPFLSVCRNNNFFFRLKRSGDEKKNED